MNVRTLTSADAARLEDFLAAHADSSMFLRSNARRGGLDYRGQPFGALYVGAVDEGRVTAVAAHAWNGMLLMQAPDHAAQLARACVAWSDRRVTGMCGPRDHVHEARLA